MYLLFDALPLGGLQALSSVVRSFLKRVDRDTVSYFYTFILIGLFVGVLGPTVPALSRQVDTSLGNMGFLFTARSAGFLVGALLLGRWFDRFDGHRVMLLGTLFVAVSLFLVPLSANFPMLLAVFVFMGASESSLDVGGNTLIARIHRDGVAPFMNGMHFFFGIGATLSPLIVAEFLNRGLGIFEIYLVAGVLTASGMALLARRRAPAAPSVSANDSTLSPPKNLLSSVRIGERKSDGMLLWLFALLFLFYTGAEVSFGGWLPSLVIRHGFGDEVEAGRVNALFFAVFTVARLVGIYVATLISPQKLLVIDLGIISVSLLLILLLPLSPALFVVLSCMIGAGMASVFPSAMSFANAVFGLTGRITSIIMIAAGLGLMVIPWLIGECLDAQGPSAAMMLLGVDVLLAIACLGTILTRRYRWGRPLRRGYRAT
jgi:FHS family Na+ dependent glucose MFS transporter 1